jgi:hypothetical protein
LPCENYEFWVCNFFAEHSTLWCIAFLHRDEELNSEETTEEEDSQNKDSLDILRKKKFRYKKEVIGCKMDSF